MPTASEREVLQEYLVLAISRNVNLIYRCGNCFTAYFSGMSITPGIIVALYSDRARHVAYTFQFNTQGLSHLFMLRKEAWSPPIISTAFLG